MELVGIFCIMMLPMVAGGFTFVVSQKAVEGEFDTRRHSNIIFNYSGAINSRRNVVW